MHQKNTSSEFFFMHQKTISSEFFSIESKSPKFHSKKTKDSSIFQLATFIKKKKRKCGNNICSSEKDKNHVIVDKSYKLWNTDNHFFCFLFLFQQVEKLYNKERFPKSLFQHSFNTESLSGKKSSSFWPRNSFVSGLKLDNYVNSFNTETFKSTSKMIPAAAWWEECRLLS